MESSILISFGVPSVELNNDVARRRMWGVAAAAACFVLLLLQIEGKTDQRQEHEVRSRYFCGSWLTLPATSEPGRDAGCDDQARDDNYRSQQDDDELQLAWGH